MARWSLVLPCGCLAAALGCSPESSGSDGGLVLVDGPPPSPAFLNLLDGDVVSAGVAIQVVDTALFDYEGLGDKEMIRERALVADIEVSGDGGQSWSSVASGVEIESYTASDLDAVWDTSELVPTPENPENEHTLRATITDDLGRQGSTSVIVRVNQVPQIGTVVIEAIEPSGSDSVFTLSTETFDPDGDSTNLTYTWYFQWDDTTDSTPNTCTKSVPVDVVQKGIPLVGELTVEDVDGGHADIFFMLAPLEGQPPLPAPPPAFCTCDTITPVAVISQNTIPTQLPDGPGINDIAARLAVLKAAISNGPFQLKQEFNVSLKVQGDSKLCAHWQTVEAEFTSGGSTRPWVERTNTTIPKHPTTPKRKLGRQCGLGAPEPCVDGYDFRIDIPNKLTHEQSRIKFNDAPGWNNIPITEFFDRNNKLAPVGLNVEARFVAHCVGTDGSMSAKKYTVKGGVKPDGTPDPPISLIIQ